MAARGLLTHTPRALRHESFTTSASASALPRHCATLGIRPKLLTLFGSKLQTPAARVPDGAKAVLRWDPGQGIEHRSATARLKARQLGGLQKRSALGLTRKVRCPPASSRSTSTGSSMFCVQMHGAYRPPRAERPVPERPTIGTDAPIKPLSPDSRRRRPPHWPEHTGHLRYRPFAIGQGRRLHSRAPRLDLS
jgi:hypothetical protein